MIFYHAPLAMLFSIICTLHAFSALMLPRQLSWVVYIKKSHDFTAE